jgi:hypothetical protein
LSGQDAQRQAAAQALREQMMREQMDMQRRQFTLQEREFQSKEEERTRKRDLERALQGAARNAYTAPSAGSLGGGVTPMSQQGQMLLGQASGDPEFDAALLQSTNAALNTVGPSQPVSAPRAGGMDMGRFFDEIAQVAPLEAMKLRNEMTPKTEQPFAKIDPKDFTEASFTAFARSVAAGRPDYAVLRPARKREFVNGVAVNAYETEPGTVINNPQQTANDLIVATPEGLRVNEALLRARRDVAAAGAPNVRVGDSISSQVGARVADSRAGAVSGLRTISTLDRIEAALDTNKAFLGPGATIKANVARFATALGAAGGDTQEKLQNTRRIVQGLAQIGLGAREQLRGTGSITDSETAALQKAESGDIDNMIAGEIRDLASIARKAAEIQLQSHRMNLDAMRAIPATTPQIPFFQVPGLDEALSRIEARNRPRTDAAGGAAPAAPTPTAPAGAPTRTIQFDSQGNRLR